MRLMRITPFGLGEVRQYASAHGALPPRELVTEYWSELHPIDIDVSAIASRVPTWLSGPSLDDAEQAIDLHQTLILPRRVAADRMVWPWLASLAFPEYTARRYSGARINRDRFGTDLNKNAIGRLWWGAELSRVDRPREVCEAVEMGSFDDPYAFSRFLFQNPTVHQELTYRTELTDRTKLIALLAFIHRRKPPLMALRSIARDASLLFSTVLLDACEISDATNPYCVDPAACAEALKLLHASIPPSKASSASREWTSSQAP